MATCNTETLIAQAVKMDSLSEAQLDAIKTSLMCSLSNNAAEVAVFQANAAADAAKGGN